MTDLNQTNHSELIRARAVEDYEKLKTILKNAVNSEKIPQKLKEKISKTLCVYGFNNKKI